MPLTLPKFEMYEEGSRIRKSSKAVTSAIVEGYGRRIYKKDFIKFLVISISECDETIVHLDFLFKPGSLSSESLYNEFHASYDDLSKELTNLSSGLKINGSQKSLNTPR